jgi:serine/threonine protein phosphatase PrpC
MNFRIDFIADFARSSNVGLVRKANEDNCDYQINTINGDIFVVCDGMGGNLGGATASKTGVTAILDYLSQGKRNDTRQAIKEALQFANVQILRKAKEMPELKGMGTTACVLLIQCGEAYIAHAGDSRIYLYSAKEKMLHRVTKDHSYVQSLVDSNQLRDEDAETHPQKNIILKALGIKEIVQPTVCKKPILPAVGDTFLICSDGLSGMIDDNIIESVLQMQLPLDMKVQNLIQLALDHGGKDNVTAQLIQITESPWKTTNLNGNDFNPKWRQKGIIPTSPFNKWIKLAVAASVVLLLGIGVTYYCKKDKSKRELRSKIKNTSEQIKKNVQDSTNLNTELKNANQRIRDSTSDLKDETVQNNLEKAKQDTACIQHKIDSLSQENKQLQDSIKMWDDKINKR